MAPLFKAICRFNAVFIKLPMTFFIEQNQIILKFIWNHKGTSIVNPEEKEQSRRHNPHKISNNIIKLQESNSMVLAQKLAYGINWNRIESIEVNPHTYGQWILDKEGKNIQWRKDSFFSKWCWSGWTSPCKLRKLEHTLTQYINFKNLKT